MTIKTFALAALLAVPAIAMADDSKKMPTTKLSDAELTIVAHVHHINVMEVDMGKLAQKQGTAAVKRYGEQLVRDHSTSDKELKELAKKRGVTKIPDEKPVTASEQQEMKDQMDQMAKLKAMKGAEFDKMYLQMMVDGHEKELIKNDTSITQVTDADLKTMLENRKTTLRKHADMAKELQKGNAQASLQPKP